MATYLVDAGNLTITTTNVVSGERRSETELLVNATKAVQTLFAELLALPQERKRRENEATAEVTLLPQPLERLPREKPPPKEKILTAWQKFALKKGIKDRTKTNTKFDEATGEFVDKWGKRAREDRGKKDWIREIKASYVPGEEGGDPFLDDKREKTTRVAKIKKLEEKNKRRSEAASHQVADLDRTMKSLATASNGKFDRSFKAGKKSKKL